jgi:hypothetical protein
MKTVIFYPLFSQELTDAIAYYEAQQLDGLAPVNYNV